MTDLGTLGGTMSIAGGINNVGQIAGSSGPNSLRLMHLFTKTA